MADLILQQPAEGQKITITPEANSRLVFGYDLSEATLSREGDDLIFTFVNGSILILTEFYEAYTADNMPTFVVEDTEIAGEEFFAALSEELMPAAGVSAGPQSGGSTVDTIHGNLLDGLSRIGRLDQEYPDDNTDEEIKEPAQYEYDFDDAGAPQPMLLRDFAETSSPTPEGGVIPEDGVTPEEETSSTDPAPSEPDAEETLPEGEGNVAPDAASVQVSVMESGVGRDAEGNIIDDTNLGDENAAYTGGIVTGQVVATDNNGDTLSYVVSDADGKYGQLVMDSTTGKFTYVLNEEAANELMEGEKALENFTVTVTDGTHTTTTTVTVEVQGTNDAPSLSLELDAGYDTSVREDSTDSSVKGSWEVEDVDGDGHKQTITIEGAQGQSLSTADSGSMTVEGEYGRLVIRADGTYEYTLYTEADGDKYTALDNLVADALAHESFTIVTTDEHGATSEVPLNIQVTGSADELWADIVSVTVDESGLAQGTDSSATSEMVTWDAPDGYTITGISEYNTELYDISKNDEGSLVLVLKDSVTHKDRKDHDDALSGGHVTVTITDDNGNSYDVTVNIVIKDDGPVILGDEAQDEEGHGETEASVSGNQATADIIVDFGADGPGMIEMPVSSGATTPLGVQWDAKEGIWEETDGSKNMYLSPGAEKPLVSYEYVDELHTITFGDVVMTSPDNIHWTVSYEVSDRTTVNLTFTDGDGDSVKHSVVAEDFAFASDVILDEAHLADGSKPNDEALTQSGNIVVSGGIPASIVIAGVSFTQGADGSWEGTAPVPHGTVSITSVTTASDGKTTINYEYTLNEAVDNGDEASMTEAETSFDVEISGEGGSAHTVTVDVTIKDDAPVAGDDVSRELVGDEPVSALVQFEFGADAGAGASIEFNGVTVAYEDMTWAEDGTTTLTFGDATLSTSNGTDWLVTMPKPENADSRSETIIVTDADGDSADVQVEASWTESAVDTDVDNLLGQAGSGGALIEGKDYNISLVLDTSGSMTANGGTSGDMRQDVQSSIEDFLEDVLFNHASQGELGGTINLQIVLFNSDANSYDFVLEDGNIFYDGKQIYASSPDSSNNHAAETIIDTFDRADARYGDILVTGSTNYDAALQESADWLSLQPTLNAQGEHIENKVFFVTDGDPTDGTFNKPIVSFDDIAGDAYEDVIGSSFFGKEQDISFDITGKILGDTWVSTGEYSQKGRSDSTAITGETTTQYQLSLTQGTGENAGKYVLTVQAIIQNDDGTTSLGEPSSVVYAPTSIEQVQNALGAGGEFIAVGFGDGINADLFQKIFGDVADSIKLTSNAAELFTPELGSISGNSFDISVADGGEGTDLIFGGMTADDIRTAVAEHLNIIHNGELFVPSVEVAMHYVLENPQWAASLTTGTVDDGTGKSVAIDSGDHDVLMGGAGDDTVYGFGGEDIIMGDGGIGHIESLAGELGLGADTYTEEALKNVQDADNDGNKADDSAELIQKLADAAQDAGGDTLEEIAQNMESAQDGHDVLYGGDDDDILLGLGGDDVLHGGSGNDILIGGSGNDTLYGGAGDSMHGGSGDDVIILDGLAIGDVLHVDGGEGNDVLLSNSESMDAVKNKLASGDMENIEVLVFGDVEGSTAKEVLENLNLDDTKRWTESTDSGVDGFKELTDASGMTILIAKHQLESGV